MNSQLPPIPGDRGLVFLAIAALVLAVVGLLLVGIRAVQHRNDTPVTVVLPHARDFPHSISK